jgi:hypothetical protein
MIRASMEADRLAEMEIVTPDPLPGTASAPPPTIREAS